MKAGKVLEFDTTCIPLELLLTSNNCPIFIRDIIKQLICVKDFTIQQECIKTIATYANTCDEISEENLYALRLLAFIYVYCTPKNPIKKTVGRFLSQYESKDEHLIGLFSENIKIVVSYLLNENNELMYNNFIFALSNGLDLSCVMEALLLNVNDVFALVVTLLQRLIEHLRLKQNEVVITLHDVELYISNACKFLLILLQKCADKELNRKHTLQLIRCCYALITEEYIEYEIKSNCGLIIVLVFNILPEDIRNLCTFKKYPYLEFLKYGTEQSFVLEHLGIQVTEPKKVETFKVCVYLGMMILVVDDMLEEPLMINGQLILSILFNEVVESTNWLTENPSLTIGVAKALAIISSHLNCLPFDNIHPLLIQGLKFITMYIHDKIEIVRINTKSILENFIKLAVNYQSRDKPELLQTILNWMKDLPECVARYSCFTVFCLRTGCFRLLQNIPNLPNQLLKEMALSASMHNVCMCYETLMEVNIKEVDKERWIETWVYPIITELKVSSPALRQFYMRLFISAFKIDTVTLQALTKTRWFETDNEICTFLGCIHYIRKVGIEVPVSLLSYMEIDQKSCWRNLLDYRTLEILCTHQNDEVRLLVLGIVADNQRSTEIFTSWELQFLMKYLHFNINASKASTRQQIVAYVKKIITRIQESYIVLNRNLQLKVVETDSTLEEYKKFWTSLFRKVLLYGINQGCNYPRRSACLELLHFIMLNAVGNNFSFKECWEVSDVDNLKNILLNDTYERNKDLATEMLVVFSPELLRLHTPELVTTYIDECLALASSIKPAETVSGGYLFKIAVLSPHINEVVTKMLRKYNCEPELQDSTYLLMKLFLSELKQRYEVGKINLQEAAKTKPLHGYIFCMRHLLKHENLSLKSNKNHWRTLIQEIITLCALITKLIATIICNKSPEGYLPDDLDSNDSEIDGTTKAQMVTVYGWRAAKEISLLFGEIASRTEFLSDQHKEGLIDEKCLKQIGDCFFYLLINTKHRGAFEQASIGFMYLCSKLWKLHDSNASMLPKIWLEDIIDLLLGDGDKTNQACETRRSAGIPFLIQAILTTESNVNGNRLFHWCMNIILNVASDLERPDEQRIHCLNILRALYRHNQLGELVLPYCAQGVIIAIEGFSSTIWCIRNSATLLFSALVVRIFGVQRSKDLEVIDIKNKMMAQIFFVRYPELYPFLLKQLDKGTRNHCSSMFPVLLILSRLYCTADSGDFSQMEEYIPFIKKCLKDSAYKTRELAAKTLINLTNSNDVPKSIVLTFIQLSNPKISNAHCHGMLLHLQYLLQHAQAILPTLNLPKILDNTAWILLNCGKQTSHLTATLYLEVLLFLLTRLDRNFSDTLLYERVETILQKQTHKNDVSTATKKFKMYIFQLRIYLMFSKFKSGKNNSPYEECISNDADLKILAMQYLLHLTFKTRTDFVHYTVHEDYYTEYSEYIEKFLNPLDSDCKRFLHITLYNELALKCKTISIEDQFVQYCSPRSITYNQQTTLEALMNGFNTTNDQTTYLSIVFLDNFLEKLDDLFIQNLDMDHMVTCLLRLSIPSADVSSRLAISELLVHNKRLFCLNMPAVSDNNLCVLWIITFLLLEDDETIVRNSISRLCETVLDGKNKDTGLETTYTFVPRIRIDICELAREHLLDQMIESTPRQCCINILLSFILRQTEVSGKNISEVFDEGALNTYAELFPQLDLALARLSKIICGNNNSLDCTKMFKLLHATLTSENIPLISDAIRLVLIQALESINSNNDKGVLDDFLLNSQHLDLLEQIRFSRFVSKIFLKPDE